MGLAMLSEKLSTEVYNARLRKVLPGGVHYNFNIPWNETPLSFKYTHGSRIWDRDDNEYLDLYARFGATIIGHGNKDYISMLADTMNNVMSVSHSNWDVKTLELLNKHIPNAEMIRFGLSGTEMVQNALRLARAHTKRNRFIRFEGHYHGNADNIMGGKVKSITNRTPVDYFGDIKGTLGRATDSMESQSYLLPWNDLELLGSFLENAHEEIACVITEPINVNGGSIMPKQNFLQGLRTLCDKYGIVLIFDEIITGVRLGLGGAQSYFGVTPDLAIFGKSIAGGGLPVSIITGRRDIMKHYEDKRVIHAGTFNGYPLGMAAVYATISILEKDEQAAIENMNLRITELQDYLVSVAKDIELPLVIQGAPGLAAFHCSDQELMSASDYTMDIMTLDIVLNDNLLKQGIMVSSVSRIYPNIAFSSDDIEWAKGRVDAAIIATKDFYNELIN